MMMEQQVVLWEQRGPVAVITLNRPTALNALNAELTAALSERLAQAAPQLL